jgi:hypothetical protein
MEHERNHYMAIQLAFNFFDADAPEMKAAAESDQSQNLRFEGIARMIADRRAPVWTIGRVIARDGGRDQIFEDAG